MALISLQDVSLSFGGPLLLNSISLQIQPGERICLLGRNGAGKSTLMKILNGDLEPDSGSVIRAQQVRSARLTQGVPERMAGTVFDIVAQGLGENGTLPAAYHQAAAQLASDTTQETLDELDRLQHELDAADGWTLNRKVEQVISLMELEADVPFETLSGGLKRRTLLARALVHEPDLLLLDEPTNHLDIESIDWLESFLQSFKGTLFFVTHDRMFLRKLATRIIELDRGRLADWACDYDTFLKRKDALLEAEEKEQALFDKRLAQEEVWIRKGIKARRTRNEGRVRALLKMRKERAERRSRIGTVRINVQEAEVSGKRVIEANEVSYSYDEAPVINDLTTTILRGDKVGIIGPNGSGKTTLLQLLLGSLVPDTGTIKHGTNLEIAYFDQHREQLDGNKTVRENLNVEKDYINIDGKERHVISYLQDFLFSPERARSYVRLLSGGERNRLLLARLFTRPSNVLVLDEPTNDLDVETLELLEELLLNYNGTLLLVSHDRTILNNVVTSTLVLEGAGKVKEYVGGYDDWLRQRRPPQPEPKKKVAPPKKPKPKVDGPRRLTYKEKMELEALPERIEALEAEQKELYDAMADPTFYQQGGEDVVKATSRLQDLKQELETTYKRWEELETIAS